MSSEDDAFIARVDKAIAERHAAEREARLADAVARERPVRTWSTKNVVLALVLAAALAALVTWLTVRPPNAETPFALGEHAPIPDAEIERDPQGRIAAIGQTLAGKPDGERLVFRAGHLIRIEHWRDGALDGPAIDLDGRGRVVQIRTWVSGKLHGPWIDFDDEGRPGKSGD